MANMQPFLLFDGKAEEAMSFYVSLFPDGKINEIDRYGAKGPGKEGTIAKASFTIAGQTILCTDSLVSQPFTFTPAISMFVNCDSESQLRELCKALAAGGAELMPLDNYGFSRLFCWLNDSYGVSWQLNLP